MSGHAIPLSVVRSPSARASGPRSADGAVLTEVTRRALATLQPQEEQVLRLRYGFGEEAQVSTAEISRRLALPWARIRQIEANALRKLRHSSRDRRLRLVD